MALMLSKTYEALLEAGASEQKAREAAEELALYELRFAKIDRDLAILKWMVAGIYAVLTIIGAPSVWVLLRVAAKVGALG
jgi:hypothetical protein